MESGNRESRDSETVTNTGDEKSVPGSRFKVPDSRFNLEL
jgi:hypothetical protein